MNFSDKTIVELKALVYDESVKVSIAQQNIRILENEIVKKGTNKEGTNETKVN